MKTTTRTTLVEVRRPAALRVGITALAALCLVLLLEGCETTTHGQEGEVIGGVIGGVLGAQVGEGSGRTAAIIIGAIAGAMIGRHVGESMDETDRIRTARVFNDSRTGEPGTWVNPDNGNQYTVTPTRTYEKSTGPCREFQLDATVGGKANEEVYGTACLQADGSWLVE